MHQPEGRILQLIAIATHPEVSKMGIGYELRSFAPGALSKFGLKKLRPEVNLQYTSRSHNDTRFLSQMKWFEVLWTLFIPTFHPVGSRICQLPIPRLHLGRLDPTVDFVVGAGATATGQDGPK